MHRRLLDWWEISAGTSFFAALTIVAAATGFSAFSPDSWSYYELSSTIFSGDFYKFNTQRSYLPGQYSAAFPMGYPVILAVARLFAGDSPEIAVAINLVFAALSWIVIQRLALTFGLSRLASFALAFSLLLWPGYLDEILSGRAIPAAMFFFLLGIWAYFKDRMFACGLALGLAALTRFDYLVFGLAFQLGALALDARRRARLPLALVGFAIGVTPWVGYSLMRFGKYWASDNSWVALAATPSFVLDYPAVPAATAVHDFGGWLSKVMGNMIPTARALRDGAIRMPLLAVTGAWVLLRWTHWPRALRIRAGWLLMLVALSTAPYLLTGYADMRYFSLLLLAATAVLLLMVEAGGVPSQRGPVHPALLAAALAGSFGVGTSFLIKTLKAAPLATHSSEEISFLGRCHSRTPEAVYIFPLDIANLGTQYGALTGRRTALIASNIKKMSPPERERYFRAMHPYVLVDPSLVLKECGVPG